jgi:hypothetical protein
MGGVEFPYQWLRGGVAVAAGDRYRLTGADAGSRISLAVMATIDRYEDGPRVGTTTVTGRVAKYAAKVRAKVKRHAGGRRARLRTVLISVVASGQRSSRVTGKVKLTRGHRRAAGRRVHKGKAVLRVQPGRYTVVYSGNRTVRPAKGRVRVTR